MASTITKPGTTPGRKPGTTPGRKRGAKPERKRETKQKASEKETKDLAESYNKFKKHNGEYYTGMKVGRSHKWYYDQGEWKERKITPDRWELTYSVTKRRAGKAPKGSGVPVGTGYHWFILSHQFVHKLNADDYSTNMVGLKLKLAHKRAGKEKWSVSETTKRKNLIKILRAFIEELESEPEKTEIVPLEFEYKGKAYKGTAVPMLSSCDEGICRELDITLNGDHLGVVRWRKEKWRMTGIAQGMASAIGRELVKWYDK